MLMAVGFAPDKDNATVAEFNRAARDCVLAFWWWAGAAALVGFGMSPWWGGPDGLAGLGTSLWWAAIPATIAIHAAICWIACKWHVRRLSAEISRLPSKSNISSRTPHSARWTKSQLRKPTRNAPANDAGGDQRSSRQLSRM
jgi:hypothetical protein